LVLGLLVRSARAELRFTEPAADAGEVRTGARLVHRFAFVNTGPDAVQITEARASCGCLTHHLDQLTYQPGEQGSLCLEVNTLGQPAGPHTWHLQVGYRGGNTAGEVPLQLTARLVAEILVQPAALTVSVGQAVSHEILLTDLRRRPLSITDVRASSPRLNADLTGAFPDGSGHTVRKIRLQVNGDYPEGRHDEVLAIYTDDPAYGELKVPVTIIKPSRYRLTVTPSQVDLVAPAGQAAPSRLVLIHDPGNGEVAVEELTADDPAIKCRWVPGPGAMATVRVSVDQTRMSGATLRSAIHVKIAKPVPEVLTVPVSCTLN
jgi:hypothetical protein